MQQPRESRFSLPWGNLAAQEWGDPNSPKKVLAIHGWMDNSNSFQKLCPLLPSDLHIVAIDLSGHGFSNPRPAGCGYNVLEFVIDVKRLVDLWGWVDFALLAHSMGAMISLLYVGLFPETVSHLISLDMLNISIFGKNLLPELVAKTISDFLVFEKKHNKAPIYKSIDEVVDRRMNATPHSISRKSAEIIMRRATMECQGGVILRTDPRLKFFKTVNFSCDSQEELLERYKGNLLVILAEHPANMILHDVPQERLVKNFEKNCKTFKLAKVHGTHTVHLDEPEKVAGIIIDFLADYQGVRLIDRHPDSRL